MRVAASWLLLLLALPAAACLRQTAFHCETDAECGAGGSCEAVGYCSFVDDRCSSGERFGESAGSYANQCVGDNALVDGGIDAPMLIDAPIDAPVVTGCPGGYAAITGGQGTHLYRLAGLPAGATGNWGQQRDFCAATSASAYLAIPDDLGELQAIATLAAVPRFWIGITDSATEDTFLTVKGATPTFLPWDPPAPDNQGGGGGEDCVEGITATSEINDERCQTQWRAVCECEP